MVICLSFKISINLITKIVYEGTPLIKFSFDLNAFEFKLKIVIKVSFN